VFELNLIATANKFFIAKATEKPTPEVLYKTGINEYLAKIIINFRLYRRYQ
jgi:hypothetical protein